MKNSIQITTSFDDGSRFDLRVFDLLLKYKIKGTFYIVVDWVGKEGYLTWDEIKKIWHHGWSIGSHTMTHPQDLKLLYDEELHFEIQNSKDLIESVLGQHITSFCYPRGRADERVKRFVADAGYIEARGTGKTGITEIKDKLYLPGTIHIFQREEYGNLSILDYAKQTIERVKKEGGYCNIWGHSQEIDRNNLWGVLEDILKLIHT
jgi:peptidoglycan/xylan/chitin deacetylase (PgdA/CDA1 family)